MNNGDNVNNNGQAGAVPIVSGESDHKDGDSEDEEVLEEEEQPLRYGDPDDPRNADHLYGADLDEEDEAWVYKNLRGGVEETVQVQRPKESASSSSSPQSSSASSRLETAKLYKPRDSDAVLACPCCFNIVCMDCQRHERYVHQFRAMFVMNIGVHWDRHLVFDPKCKGLVEKPAQMPSPQEQQHRVPSDDDDDKSSNETDSEFYYPVYCLNCQTQLAALDMTDEVYHFYGVIASS